MQTGTASNGNDYGKGGKPKPTPSPTPNPDGESDWNNAGGTAWNTGANWTAVTGSAPPAIGDVAWFKTAFAAGQPSLSTPVSIAGLYFTGTGTNGYAIARTGTGAFTLTGFATTIGAETSNATAVAIGAENTSGTNSINVPITLAPASGTKSIFFQNAGGTLSLLGTAVISGVGIELDLTGGGTISLAGTNTYSGGTVITGGTTAVNANATSPFGTGTLTLNSGSLVNSTTSTPRTLSNVVSITGDFTFDSGGAGGTNVFTGGGSTTGSRILTVNTTTTSLTTAAFTLGGNLTTAGSGALTLSGGLNLGAVDRTITGGATGQTTISGAVDSSASGHKLVLGGTNVTMSAITPGATNTVNFEVNSTGPVLFTGAGAYLGTTTLTAGELSFGSSTALSGGAISTGPVGKGTLHLGSGTNSAILSTNVSGGTTRTIQNSVTLDGDLTFQPGSGQTTGRIALDVATGLTIANTFTLTRTNQLSVATGETVDLIGAITGSTFGITKLGAGTLNFGNGGATDPNANTFNGLTTVSAGLVNLRKAANVDAIAGDLLINGTGTVATAHNEEINNASSVTVNSTGALSLGANTETIANLTVGSGSVSGGGGTLIIAGSGTTSVDSGTVSVSNLTTGTTGLSMGSGATVAAAGTSGTTTLNGDVSFTGATTGATLGAVGVVNSGVTLNGNRNFTVADASAATDLTVAGVISNGTVSGSGVTKLGAGTMAFTAANTYTGATNVNAGTLYVNGSLAAGSAVTVSNGGTILGGTGGTINGTVSVGSAAILQGGTGATGQTLNLAGAVTMNTGSILSLALGAGGAHSTIATTNPTFTFATNQDFKFIDVGATTTTYNGLITGVADPGVALNTWVIDNAGYLGSFSWDAANGGEIDLTLTAIPEPGTWFAAALAIGGLLITQRKRFKALRSRA